MLIDMENKFSQLNLLVLIHYWDYTQQGCHYKVSELHLHNFLQRNKFHFYPFQKQQELNLVDEHGQELISIQYFFFHFQHCLPKKFN